MSVDRLHIVCDVCKAFKRISRIYSDYQLELCEDSLEIMNEFFAYHYECAASSKRWQEVTFSFANERDVYGDGDFVEDTPEWRQGRSLECHTRN